MAYLRAGDQDGALEMLRQMVWVLKTLQVFCLCGRCCTSKTSLRAKTKGTPHGSGLPVEMFPIKQVFAVLVVRVLVSRCARSSSTRSPHLSLNSARTCKNYVIQMNHAESWLMIFVAVEWPDLPGVNSSFFCC